MTDWVPKVAYLSIRPSRTNIPKVTGNLLLTKNKNRRWRVDRRRAHTSRKDWSWSKS